MVMCPTCTRRVPQTGAAHLGFIPAPTYGEWLPGGGYEVRIDGEIERPIDVEHAYLLHAAITAAIGGHRQVTESGCSRLPDWSLVPWNCASGWGTYWGSADFLDLAGTRYAARIGRSSVSLGFGALARMRSPAAVRSGWHVVVLEAISPVVIQSDNRSRSYTTPYVMNLVSTLGKLLRPRLGIEPRVDDLGIEILERHTESRRFWGGPTLGDHGGVQGWVGSVTLRCNAPATWLLMAAARGPGLGGRTAYGCGRIFVREVLSVSGT